MYTLVLRSETYIRYIPTTMDDKIVRGTCNDMCPFSERRNIKSLEGKTVCMCMLRVPAQILNVLDEATLPPPIVGVTLRYAYCKMWQRERREQEHRLHSLEMVNGTEKSKRPQADPQASIKEYSRPAAGKAQASPTDLRPIEVLLSTVKYMVNRVLNRCDWPWLKLYNFVFDRLRSVRQDMVIQRLTDDGSVQIYQWAVRFYVYAAYRLCTESMSSFDPKINQDHLQECLKRLLVLYQLSECKHHPYRAEFESLYLLYNLGSFEATRHAMALPKHIWCHREVQLAFAITRAFWEGNFVRLWRLSEQCSYIQSCALQRHMTDIRWKSLCTLNTAYSSKNLSFPLPVLAHWLLFDSESDALKFSQLCGLDASLTGVKFQKGCLQNSCSNIKPSHSFKLVDKKWDEAGFSSVADVILDSRSDVR